MLPITTLYTIIFGIIFLILSARTILARQDTKVSLGDGDNPKLKRRIRVHGNFAEYVPFIIVIMLMLELQSVSSLIIHGIGSLLLCGRILHAISIDSETPNLTGRIAGMALTFTALGGGLLALFFVLLTQ